MPQTAQKKKPKKALASKSPASAKKTIEKVIISCWEQDYELPEILASLHHYNLDAPALKSCVEWLLLTEKIAEFNFKPNANKVAEQLEKIKEQVKAESPAADSRKNRLYQPHLYPNRTSATRVCWVYWPCGL